MGDLPRRTHFRVESRERRRILRQRFGKKFDGHDLAEFQVFGPVNFTHAAPAG